MKYTIYFSVAMLSIVACMLTFWSFPIYIEDFLLFMDLKTIIVFMPASCFLVCITGPTLLAVIIKPRKIYAVCVVVQLFFGLQFINETLYFTTVYGRLVAFSVGLLPPLAIGVLLMSMLMLDRKNYTQNE
jgi:hypothetical protein